MLTALWLSACLTASPTYSLMVSRRVGLTPAQAEKLTEQLAKELAKEDLGIGTLMPVKQFTAALKALGLDDPTVCAGALTCVADYGRGGGVEHIISLQLMKVGKEVAIDTSVVRVARADVLAAPTDSVILASPAKGLVALAKKLVQALASRPKDEPEPLKPSPAPEPTPEPVAKAEPVTPPPQTSPEADLRSDLQPRAPSGSKARALRLAAIGLTAATLVSAGVGVGLGVVAMGQANGLRGNDRDYDQKRAGTLGLALGADVAYAVAGALGITAIVLFVVSATGSSASASFYVAPNGAGLTARF